MPDPPLRSGALRLRPWVEQDAPALVRAWADAEVQRWTLVPAGRELDDAVRWIAGDERRRAAGQSLDLVVLRDGQVAGEVGLAAFDAAGTTAELGWWTARAHRERGVASTAVACVARWALHDLGLRSVTARCHPDNGAACAVARRAGLRPVGEDGDAVTFELAASSGC